MTKEEYLKHKDVIDAWANGAKIEASHDGKEWFPCDDNPNWFLSVHFRVKPVPTYLELHQQSEFNTGDKVRITRMWDDTETDGELTCYGSGETLNKTGVIKDKDDDSYCVFFEDMANFWYFPYFVLEKVVEEYIPFTFEDDLVGKIVVRKTKKVKFLILGQTDNSVFVGIDWLSTHILLEDFMFLDGSPCGRVKQ